MRFLSIKLAAFARVSFGSRVTTSVPMIFRTGSSMPSSPLGWRAAAGTRQDVKQVPLADDADQRPFSITGARLIFRRLNSDRAS